MNVAAVLCQGSVCGMVPKSHLPTYREFYESRHFRPGHVTHPALVSLWGQEIAFGTDILFRSADAIISVEICEDLWTPIPPSSHASLAGANVLVNLSASNETIGKAAWRRELVRSQSGRCLAAYAYASSGPGESTSDLVFGGHCLIAENGHLLDESQRIGDGLRPDPSVTSSITVDVDLDRLAHERRVVGTFWDNRAGSFIGQSANHRVIEIARNTPATSPPAQLKRHVDGQPFVPSESSELDARCQEIIEIQTAGLTKRLSRLPDGLSLSIGISGGLDSTLALLIALRACDTLGYDRKRIHGITMPGFGTTSPTLDNARELINTSGVTAEQIDIRGLCLQTFRSLGHAPLGISIDADTTADSFQAQLRELPDDITDLTFENVQARVRTMLLMNRGFVLGTGDMSEQALGWSTYNGDHMSMYNVNTSIPKTLVRFLVRYLADHQFQGKSQLLLHRIADTPISPELLPPAEDGSIRQSTEATLGPYELHDFFLYHFIRHGCSRDKLRYLASQATFSRHYDERLVATTLDRFFDRFFANQFKRNCVPDGPKVGTVSLSPRGDWRMPSDADRFRWD